MNRGDKVECITVEAIGWERLSPLANEKKLFVGLPYIVDIVLSDNCMAVVELPPVNGKYILLHPDHFKPIV